jgi:hypothetical protein
LKKFAALAVVARMPRKGRMDWASMMAVMMIVMNGF